MSASDVTVQANPFAILVSAILFFILGGIWYSPLLFVERWKVAIHGKKLTQAEETCMRQETNLAFSFGLMFLGSLFMSLVSAHFVLYMLILFPNQDPVVVAIRTGTWLWFGFNVPALFANVAFERRPIDYFMINGLYWLCGIVSSSIIHALWRV